MHYLTSDLFSTLPHIRHGFFTRNGGVSEGIYKSLNCGPGSRDREDYVFRNRALVAEAMGAKPEALCTQYQVHGNEVTVVTRPWVWENSPQTDAMVTATPGIVLGILTADCVPILFADRANAVIGAAHAGWKGASSNITEETIKAMEGLGARRASIVAAIGPAIERTSYEVGPEYFARFLEMDPRNRRYFLPEGERKYRFDLKGYVRDRLEESGISGINLLANDTCLEENDFFSYRRSTLRAEPDYGRQISAIMLI